MAGKYITSSRKVITLGNSLGSGAEGEVYRVNELQSVALKLYKPEKRTPDQEGKLAAMIMAPPRSSASPLPSYHVSIAWPTEIVYEYGTGKFVGFVMPLIQKSPNIYEIYNPGLRIRNAYSRGITWQTLHCVARNFAAVLQSLHASGHIMGDVNQKNILVDNNSLVTLVDTDSFQVTNPQNKWIYRCTVGSGEYTPPELQGKRFDSLDRTVYHDYFGLAVIIFQVLMEGFHPFSGAPKNLVKSALVAAPDERIKSGDFPYHENCILNPPPNAPTFQALHPALRTLFIRCFVDGHTHPSSRPTAMDWISALQVAESGLEQCRNNPQHWYSSSFRKCHWCECRPILSESTNSAPSSSISSSVGNATQLSASSPRSLSYVSSSRPWLSPRLVGGLLLIGYIIFSINYADNFARTTENEIFNLSNCFWSGLIFGPIYLILLLILLVFGGVALAIGLVVYLIRLLIGLGDPVFLGHLISTAQIFVAASGFFFVSIGGASFTWLLPFWISFLKSLKI